MVEAITHKLARHLHDRHHRAELWDSCVQGCRDFYSLMADSAILYLKEHDHMKQTLGDQLRQRRAKTPTLKEVRKITAKFNIPLSKHQEQARLDDRLAAQMEGGE